MFESIYFVESKLKVIHPKIGASSLFKLKYIILYIICVTNVIFSEANYNMISDLGSSAAVIRKANIEGFSNSSNLIFENPAALFKIKNTSASFFTSTIMNEVSFN